MKRATLILAITTLALLAVAQPATATAATCSTHILAATSWSVQTDTFNGRWDFQCGGAENLDWLVDYSLQKQNADGSWTTPQCDNGNACSAERPSQGLFPAGQERSGNFTFNPAIQLDCKNWRIKGFAIFQDGSKAGNWFSLTYQIGGPGC